MIDKYIKLNSCHQVTGNTQGIGTSLSDTLASQSLTTITDLPTAYVTLPCYVDTFVCLLILVCFGWTDRQTVSGVS